MMVANMRQMCPVSRRQIGFVAVALLLLLSLAMLKDITRQDISSFAETVGSRISDFSKPQDHKASTDTSHEIPFENPGGRPLITYVYAESDHARENFMFFVKHALHSSADFVFIFNGETEKDGVDVQSLLPQKANIRYVRRSNDCFDLGAHAEVLTKDDLWKRYKGFIIMNASIRGPFMPHWSSECWSNRYLSKVTSKVKLVGISLNCWPTVHVQSMLWATDDVGLGLLLYPPEPTPNHDFWAEQLPKLMGEPEPPTEPEPADNRPVKEGINTCFHNYDTAVVAEVGGAPIILHAGYRIDVMLAKFQADVDYVQHCEGQPGTDVMLDKMYDGANVHPYETIFMKTNRYIDPITLENLSKWTDSMGYTSYDYC